MGKKNMKKYWLPWLVGMPAETSRAMCSMIFGGIFDKFPNLRVNFAMQVDLFCQPLEELNMVLIVDQILLL